MSLFRGSLLLSVIAVGLSAPAFAQPKADAGSGPTKGAVSTDDAGSGPTKGAKPITDTTSAEPRISRKQRRRYSGSEIDRRGAACDADDAREKAATRAAATIAPIPGIVVNRRASSFSFAQRTNSASKGSGKVFSIKDSSEKLSAD